MKRLRAAFVMLTRLPLADASLDQRSFETSAAFFPWVGVVIGVITGFAYALGQLVSETVGGIFALAAGLLVTGAMHEDGLADCADAFFGTSDEARARTILKDPRLGTFGGVALIVVLALRVAMLPSVLEHAMANLVLAATLGRASILVVLLRAPYAGAPETQKTGPVAAPRAMDVLVAVLAPVLVGTLAFLDHRVTLLGLGTATLAVLVLAFGAAGYGRARLGGWVGDVLGATEQLSECAVLFALAVFAPA